ncbi:MAG: serine/threonine protein kinase [Planctomycetes bacterium]|nr:serine/threonine protein kinase [Planctomycetota bacterium]
MRYRILTPLGKGSFGNVFRAQDPRDGRIVALKLLSPALKSTPQAIEAFHKEAALTAILRHPNIVSLYESGEFEEQYYLAMEFIDGATLREVLRRHGHLPVEDALFIGAEICRGLAHAHHRQLVHRDIKPTNILIANYVPKHAADGPPATVKILDFGLGKSIAHAAPTSTALAGTPFYISPEQIRGDAVDARTDIYAFGVTLFEMLTGTVPFTTGDVYAHHLSTPAPAPSDYVDVLPKMLDPIVLRCLEKDPAKRYPGAEAVLSVLEGARRKGPFPD